MKKLYLLTAAIFLFGSVHAQNLTVKYDTVEAEGPSHGMPLLSSYLYNNSSSAVNLQWERTVNDIPSGWASLVCIYTTCYDANTSSAPFDDPLAPGDSAYVSGYFETNDIYGSGHFRVVIWDASDSANTSAAIDFFYDGWPLGVDNPSTAEPKIFPVPATDHIKVEQADAFQNYRLLDMGGRLIDAGALSGQAISMGHLVSGMYILELEGEEGTYQKLVQKQ